MLSSIATFNCENCCNDPTSGPKELSKAGIDYFANVLSHTVTRLCKIIIFMYYLFYLLFILVPPPASENRHHLFTISVHRHILSCDLLDRETYRCSLMFKQSRSACVNSSSHGYKAGMRVVSITTTRAADTCVRQHSTIVFRYETCVFYSAAPPCTRKGSLLRNVEKREGKREVSEVRSY